MEIGQNARYYCGDKERREALERALLNGVDINGIDYLEVVDTELLGTPAEASRQQILLVQCFASGIDTLTAANVRIDGGVRVTPVLARWAHVLSGITAAAPAEIPAAERDFLANYRLGELDRDRILVVGTDSGGDFSTYNLSLVAPGETVPPPDFDPRLSIVPFSFKVECPSDFDCKPYTSCPPPDLNEPEIDYLAKDYTSFRRLMLDRMSAIAPDWQERNPADLGVALVELLSYVGDQLSYYQDAVSTEAYLGTARQRISVRRHVRLVDYFLSEGAAARAWVALEVAAGGPLDGDAVINPPEPLLLGPDPDQDRAGVALITRQPGRPVTFAAANVAKAARSGAVVFETLHGLTPYVSLNQISFHTWSDRACCLPVGATRATLRGPLPNLHPGRLLLFEEIRGPQTGAEADADPEHRHVVRLIDVRTGFDPIFEPPDVGPIPVVEIEWHADDALSFPLCLSSETDEEHGAQFVPEVSVARGNVLLAGHGCTLSPEELEPVPPDPSEFLPLLASGPLAHAAPLSDDFSPEAQSVDNWPSAASAQSLRPSDAKPEIRLESTGGEWWTPARDLLSSGPFANEFVAEIESDGRARLRFGDDLNGKAPTEGTQFEARYRIGNGVAGNIGRDSLAHIVVPDGVTRIWNPLPADGGVEPESLEQARRFAPQAFRVQERAVTANDYARVTERHPDVQRAAASFRWTGSWYTVFISIDRKAGLAVDEEFETSIRNHLNRFRMAGYDLDIDPPRFVPLDIKLVVCVEEDYFRGDVKAALLEAFSNRRLADGTLGFFHPDNWSFDQPVYLSRIYETAAAVPGVDSVVVEKFQRWAHAAQDEIANGVLETGRLEIIRLDNDPNFRENGLLELEMKGGL
jgi:hypothetical protein